MTGTNRFLPAAIIFVAAFLVFQVQPIIGKFILPWFGGTPAVWTMCMLFFQAALFAGYCYAHLLASRCRLRSQAIMHGVMLCLAAGIVLARGILPAESFKPAADASPSLSILLTLLATVGLPYFVLAATSPLIQSWHSATNNGKEPYALYSVSNVGSLLALLTYPFLVEPALPLRAQSKIWSTLFLACAAGCFVLMTGHGAWLRNPVSGDAPRKEESAAGRARTETPGIFNRVCWFMLPMTACVLLLAITNQLCTDVSSGPFLWLLPLSIYLITFIVTFSGWRFAYGRPLFFCALIAGCLAIAHVLANSGNMSFPLQTAIYCAVLYCGCTAAHGELYRLRPPASKLTAYYLSISAGGAAGGVFTGLLAPRLFSNFYELHGSLAAILIMVITCGCSAAAWSVTDLRRRAAFAAAMVAMLVVGVAFSRQIRNTLKSTCEIRRSFFGVVRIEEKFPEVPMVHQYRMMHGNTSHGFQFINPLYRRNLTSYFAKTSGIGLAFDNYPRESSLRVGIVGLGIGTIAGYARPGDEFRFYEINPDVISFAQDERYFDYVAHARRSGATVVIVPGDGRLSLEREEHGAKFDVLVLDAFTSDAIPTHLLTMEAFALYLRMLKAEGILAVNVTNKHIDAAPLILAMAEYYGYRPFFIANNMEVEKGIHSANWVLLSNNPVIVNKYYTGRVPIPPEQRMQRPWTDDFCDLWSVMRKQKMQRPGK